MNGAKGRPSIDGFPLRPDRRLQPRHLPKPGALKGLTEPEQGSIGERIAVQAMHRAHGRGPCGPAVNANGDTPDKLGRRVDLDAAFDAHHAEVIQVLMSAHGFFAPVSRSCCPASIEPPGAR